MQSFYFLLLNFLASSLEEFLREEGNAADTNHLKSVKIIFMLKICNKGGIFLYYVQLACYCTQLIFFCCKFIINNSN